VQNNGEGPPVPTRVVSTCEDGSVLSVDSFKLSEGVRPLNELVMEAAMSCGDALVGSFLSTLKERECEKYVIQTSLLLFLDMDKSDKLSEAFRLLSQVAEERTTETGNLSENDVETITKDAGEAASLKHESEANKSKPSCGIDRKGAVTLFRCFLTAISSCIQSKEHAKTDSKGAKDKMGPPAKVCKQAKDASPNTPSQIFKSGENDGDSVGLEIPRASPSFDSAMDTSIASLVSLPRETLLEIDEIASFASEKLIQFATKQQDATSLISFETFGDWYNSKGFMVVPWLELMDLAKWDVPINAAVGHTLAPAKNEASSAKVPTSSNGDHRTRSSPVNFFVDDRKQEQTSRTLVTFDFTGTADESSTQSAPLCINITEENLVTLKSLVSRTGLLSRSPDEIIDILLRQSTMCYIEGKEYTILEKNDFGRCIRLLVPAETSRNFSRAEMEQFSNYFMTVFGCYENKKFGKATVDVKELAIGFSVMCAGSKSVKLSSGFDLLDKARDGHIDQEQLSKYVRSYLTMLVAISLLSTTPAKLQPMSSTKQKGMVSAVENGAKWTLGHYQKSSFGTNCKIFTFETFAQWYTEGGYNVAPWLELLDLSKLLALLDDPTESRSNFPVSLPRGRGQLTSPRKRSPRGQAPVDVLFTFPLAKDRSLVVLREDAIYVRSVVEKLGLLSMNPDHMWYTLFKSVKARPPRPAQPWSRHRKSGTGKSMDVDQATFVRCLEEIVTLALRENKRMAYESVKVSSASIPETIANFFQSFDLEQIDRVALNQLMGGLSLLCGGKKSTKLAFSFGLFDGRQEPNGRIKSPHPSLDGEELFLFLRSFLIVMFSCCRQSLDLSAEAVSRYISDTSHMVTEDVMRYQWHTRKRDRVDFDDFGEWYNEGGFETAPWLELLDLKKWVLVEDAKTESNQGSTARAAGEHISRNGTNHYCPPPPPEDSVDPSFFGDDDNTLMPMDSIDEMDLLLMAQPSHDKENDVNFLGPNSPHPRSMSQSRPSSSLKFHLVTHDDHGGYMLAVSQKRVRHLRQVLIESGLHKMDSETACRRILNKATRVNGKLVLKKSDFDSAVRGILSHACATGDLRGDSQSILSDLFSFLFSVFDRKKNGAPSAMEIACGFTVICDGKKSDKLEFAFDVLDENRDGKLSRKEMTNYLRSFLTVLLGLSTCAYLETDPSEDSFLLMSGKPYDASIDSIAKASKSGSDWAANQAFKACFAAGKSEEELSFDDFADWYTRKGFGSIPWLELLDLKKWVLTETF
jgi:Ca2+-binding EF-hand superfamily protein